MDIGHRGKDRSSLIESCNTTAEVQASGCPVKRSGDECDQRNGSCRRIVLILKLIENMKKFN